VLSVQLRARILTIYVSELVSGKLPPEINYPSRPKCSQVLVHFWTRGLRPQRTWKNIPNWQLDQYEQYIGWLMRGDGSAGTGSQSPFCGLYVMGAMFGSTLFPSLACRLTPDTAAGTRYHITCVSIQFPSQGRVWHYKRLNFCTQCHRLELPWVYYALLHKLHTRVHCVGHSTILIRPPPCSRMLIERSVSDFDPVGTPDISPRQGLTTRHLALAQKWLVTIDAR